MLPIQEALRTSQAFSNDSGKQMYYQFSHHAFLLNLKAFNISITGQRRVFYRWLNISKN